MTTDTEKRTLSKRQLELTAPITAKTYGPEGAKTLWKFGAVDRSLPEGHPRVGKAIGFTTFNTSLKDHLEGLEMGAAFVGDYEVKPRPDKPEYGPDITLIQIYVDDKPVSQKKDRGGGGGYRGRSLEEDLALERIKRVSIEGQNGVGHVIAVIAAGPEAAKNASVYFGTERWTAIVDRAAAVLERQLDGYLNGSGPAATPQKPPDTPPADRQRARKSEAAPPDPKPQPATSDGPGTPGVEVGMEIRTVGDLFTAAGKLKPPISREGVLELCGVSQPTQIQNLNYAWATVLDAHGKTSEEAFDDLKR
jgi:hypothetical protein